MYRYCALPLRFGSPAPTFLGFHRRAVAFALYLLSYRSVSVPAINTAPFPSHSTALPGSGFSPSPYLHAMSLAFPLCHTLFPQPSNHIRRVITFRFVINIIILFHTRIFSFFFFLSPNTPTPIPHELRQGNPLAVNPPTPRKPLTTACTYTITYLTTPAGFPPSPITSQHFHACAWLVPIYAV
jgi:hypothetical protein